MADNRLPSFLHLSTELRLEVYQYVVIESLTQGSLDGLPGLYLSCREVHHELETEFIGKIRPLLLALRGWKTASRDNAQAQRTRLRLKPTHHIFASNTTPTNLTISLPVLQSWLMDSRAWTNPNSDLQENELFKGLLFCLRPLVRLRWSVLTLNLSSIAYAPGISFNLTAKISEAFFRCLSRLEDDGVCNFHQVDRLVLNYGSGKDMVDEGHFQMLFLDFQHNWRHSGSPNVMRAPTKGWICRQQGGADDGWKLVYDYQDGLTQVEGALWEIVREEGYWKGKRLFKGDLDQIQAGYEWEQEYDTEVEEEEWESSDKDVKSDQEDDTESKPKVEEERNHKDAE